MLRGAKNRLDMIENIRHLQRILLSSLSYKKYLLLLFCLGVILYVISPLTRWLFSSNVTTKEPLLACIDEHINHFYSESVEYNSHIIYPETSVKFAPYVGNGYFGLEVKADAHLNIKHKRSLNLPVYFHPFVSLSPLNEEFREAFIVEYLNGIVHRFQCFKDYFVSYEYFAHRNLPSVLVQEIKFLNYRSQVIEIDLKLPWISDWSTAVTRDIKLQHGSTISEYQLISGMIELEPYLNDVIAVSIITRKLPQSIKLKKRGITKLDVLIAIKYSSITNKSKFTQIREQNDKLAIEMMRKALQKIQHEEVSNALRFKQQHIKVWRTLWETGFSISTSKAENSVNGDRINATIYSVLSQVRSFEFEDSITPHKNTEIERALTYAEGCYDSYHTLQASNLWLDMGSLNDLNSMVSSWILTLEKQGCHNLIKAGASGVMQAMVLSFGGFRFRNQHLELNIHPKFLHRDYHFRRLNYGNMTHVNVTISVTDDNKAVIYVALDRSDKSYYACDAGCLDDPVLLGPTKKTFPVKLTDPVTAILYITADKQHMSELHQAIHVKEVIEAPAHEQHIIALHKHGHRLGGLPTFFWISICAIIIIFHAFLCKLIIKEYCESVGKFRYRYSKL